MVHDLSPFLWRISGEFGIRWYGLSYLAGFIGGYLLIHWLCSRQRSGLAPALIGDLVTYIAIGTLVGGRLGYCVFYSPDLFLQFKPSFPYWGVLAVNEGGMASHGGMIGIVIACALFGIKNGISKLYLYDLIAISAPIGVFFGRIANFINGELVGRPADPSVPLAVKFPTDIYSWPGHDASKLAELSTVVEKLGVSRDQWLEWVDKFRVDAPAREQINSSLTRIVHSIQDGNSAVKEAIAPFLEARHPSQLYAAAGEGLLIFIVLMTLWSRPQKPGVIGATFVMVYAMVRIIDEQFRMPDAHIGYQLFNLTRGQWLSIGMFFIGVVLAFLWGRRETLPIPGWGRAASVKLHRRD